jgi:hypothetical protein
VLGEIGEIDHDQELLRLLGGSICSFKAKIEM